MQKSESRIKNKLYSLVFKHIADHGLINYDNFTESFVDAIIDQFQTENFDLDHVLNKAKGSFLRLNRIEAEQFLSENLRRDIFKSWNQAQHYSVPPLSLQDLFPTIIAISDKQAQATDLDIDESIIQNEFRHAFRELGGAPIARRGKDSALEVADIEHFRLKIKSLPYSFAVVVKGYNSIGPKINTEAVMHQVTKAFRTRPDYILLVSAKEPVDSFVSELVDYSKSVYNPNLIIFVPPLDLAKFLILRKTIDLIPGEKRTSSDSQPLRKYSK